MKKYTVEIQFEKEKYCLNCPLRDDEYDGCNLQVEDGCYIQFENWEEQMKNCPLKEIQETIGDKCVSCGNYTGVVNVKVCNKCANEYKF